jgi:hypothetical protein
MINPIKTAFNIAAGSLFTIMCVLAVVAFLAI